MLKSHHNDCNKKIIVEEGGISPLSKLLKEASSPESQIAAAIALFNLGNNQERARLISDELGVSIIVQAFGRKSPIRVRIAIAKLIGRMSEFDPVSQEGFGRENVIRPLVTMLSFETFVDDDKLESVRSVLDKGKPRDYEAESENSVIKIPAIKAIDLLARTFPARETRVIGPLVKQHNHQNPDVGTESAIALGKFLSPDNFLCTQHSKTVIEFDRMVPLMRLLRESERTQYHALVVLCYLALHAGNSEALVHAWVLTTLEGADRDIVGQHSELKELVVKAIYHLNLIPD
ncbi:hypothetical protein L6452_39734 [Arctium lappa]|uniref:Uncharacterized protein n=1 Tax=Arctium lappa TaxID=4217 RepID=A0ACB8XTZ9_ARCLA|nr:hypothetical protein L6452_39734 [Arctium lappa]